MRADMHLSAEWLSRKQADTLAEQLQDLWREQGQGAPICFTWTDWIQNNALPFLGITERLLLTFNPHAAPVAAAAPQNSREREHAEDTRAGSSETRVEQGDECAESDVVRVAKLYTRLAAYSKMWERQLFQEVSTPSIHPSISRSGMRQTCVLGLSSAHVTTLKLPQLLWCYGDALRVTDVFWTPTSHSFPSAVQAHHSCGICMEDVAGPSFVWPGGCDHAYCRDCIQQLCSLHVAEGALENLRCPQPDCKQPFDRQVHRYNGSSSVLLLPPTPLQRGCL